jgi:hypothetical protein
LWAHAGTGPAFDAEPAAVLAPYELPEHNGDGSQEFFPVPLRVALLPLAA